MMKRLLMMMSLTMAIAVSAQDAGKNQQSKFDTSLARHDFFYAGQSKQRRMFIVKDGQVNWSYQDQLKRGEISDAVLMSDGHILVAHQYGVAEVDAQGTTVWNYAAPEGTEIHTVQPIGTTHVVFVQNGKPAKAVASCFSARTGMSVSSRPTAASCLRIMSLSRAKAPSLPAQPSP